MPTHFMLRSDGTLRHGHGNINAPQPEKEQWHDADTYHRADPHGHDREESWVRPIWSDQNWNVSRERKDELVLKAYLDYERNALRAQNSWEYRVASKPHPRAVIEKNNWLPKAPPADDETVQSVDEHQPDKNWHDQANELVREIDSVLKPADPKDKLNAWVDEIEKDDYEPLPEVTPAPKVEIYEEPLPDAPVEYSPSSLADIEERLATVEEVALEHLPAMDSKIKLLEDKQRTTERTESEVEASLVSIRQQLTGLESRTPDVTAAVQVALVPLEARVNSIEAAQARKVEYTVRTPDQVIVSEGVRHEAFDKLLMLTLALDPFDRNLWLTGPAGSGKTKMAPQLAEALGFEFEASGPLDTPYKISGYKDANGNYHDTAFRRRFENGGVMLCDEVDFSHPGALAEINAATSNGWAAFPDGMVKRHKNFICLAAANTYGMGGDAVYIGTTRQNAASLDRFVMIDVNYDEALELSIALDEEWTRVVQTCRAAANTAGAQIVISPRASIKGGQLLSDGVPREWVLEALFGKHKKLSTYETIFRAAIDWSNGISAARAVINNGAARTGGLPKVDFSRTRVR